MNVLNVESRLGPKVTSYYRRGNDSGNVVPRIADIYFARTGEPTEEAEGIAVAKAVQSLAASKQAEKLTNDAHQLFKDAEQTIGAALEKAEEEEARRHLSTEIHVARANRIRTLSLPKSVALAGGLDAWNRQPPLATRQQEMAVVCTAATVDEAVAEVSRIIHAGENLKAYTYIQELIARDRNVGYGAILAEPELLLPIVYTPTVGEACQKFGTMPVRRRGLYLSIKDRGNFAAVLREYARAELDVDASGTPLCDCMVFSDGGRILGLGDLGTWGMGIPIGKLDLYTACGGFNPRRTVPVMIDAGCGDAEKNTAKLIIRDHALYTGAKDDRQKHVNEAGTEVNSAYYGEGNVIEEFLEAATCLFGRELLMQFEDFSSNDAFPLLAQYRDMYLCYNDDIQGTAAVVVAGILGGIKLRHPECTDLLGALQHQTFLFHGAGAANLGAMNLLAAEGHVDAKRLSSTNSRGLIWVDATSGNFRNVEQRTYAYDGKPSFLHGRDDLASIVAHIKPSCLIGAVGVAPGCFNQEIVKTMCGVNSEQPIIFALSNPQSQAEVTAEDCYTWSHGQAIFGSGTMFGPVTVEGLERRAGQVNNVYIFPGVSFGAWSCGASSIPDRLFLVAAEAVANSLTTEDISVHRVIPSRARLRHVSLNVATAVVMEAQRLHIARKPLGVSEQQVRNALSESMWAPTSDPEPENQREVEQRRTVSTNDAVDIGAKLAEQDLTSDISRSTRWEITLTNNGVRWTVLLMIMLLNIVAMVNGVSTAVPDDTRQVEPSKFVLLCFARGSGKMITINAALLICTLCKVAIAASRKIQWLSQLSAVDDLMPTLHTVLGKMLVITSLVHTLAQLGMHALHFPSNNSSSWQDTFAAYEHLISGTLIVLSFVALVVTAREAARTKDNTGYHRFLYVHRITAVVIFATLIVHGTHFGEMVTFKFIIGPLICVGIDLAYRAAQLKVNVKIQLQPLPNGFTKVSMKQQGFRYKIGQYVYLKVPSIGVQAKPFSLASHPDIQAEQCLFIESRGLWTSKLHEMSRDGSGKFDVDATIMGPHGASAELASKFKHRLFVCAGSGLTPFMAHFWDFVEGVPKPETEQSTTITQNIVQENIVSASKNVVQNVWMTSSKFVAWRVLNKLVSDTATQYGVAESSHESQSWFESIILSYGVIWLVLVITAMIEFEEHASVYLVQHHNTSASAWQYHADGSWLSWRRWTVFVLAAMMLAMFFVQTCQQVHNASVRKLIRSFTSMIWVTKIVMLLASASVVVLFILQHERATVVVVEVIWVASSLLHGVVVTLAHNWYDFEEPAASETDTQVGTNPIFEESIDTELGSGNKNHNVMLDTPSAASRSLTFVWITRGTCEWFISEIEDLLRAADDQGLHVEVKVFLTRATELPHFPNARPNLHVSIGRPDIDTEILGTAKRVGELQKDAALGVFCCTGPALTQRVAKVCYDINCFRKTQDADIMDDAKIRSRMFFNSESFQ